MVKHVHSMYEDSKYLMPLFKLKILGFAQQHFLNTINKSVIDLIVLVNRMSFKF